MIIFVKSHQTVSTAAYVVERRGYVDCELNDTSDWMLRVCHEVRNIINIRYKDASRNKEN